MKCRVAWPASPSDATRARPLKMSVADAPRYLLKNVDAFAGFGHCVGTYVAGAYGKSVLGGVMGDFLGATICMLEVGCLLAMSADFGRADARAIAWLVGVVSAPQLYALCFGRQTPETAAQEC